MIKIGLLSDTHSYIDPKVFKYFADVDEIWHAGDIGDMAVTDELSKFKPLRAVYGNIDNQDIRCIFREVEIFVLNGLKVVMIHIGGYPGHYAQGVRDILMREKPDVFVCGHSHILKVIFDKQLRLLHLNPGAAGFHGFHQVKTLLRFEIHEGKVQNMEVIELGLRGR